MADLVLVCGSRTWVDGDAIRARLRDLTPGSTVMHGGARGADKLAGTIARGLGLDVVEMRAEWEREGRAAGIRRNLRMLDREPDRVLAFWMDGSRGTQHVIDVAMARGIPVEIHVA